MLSRILADLLDPQGSHCQKSVFLKAFLVKQFEEFLGNLIDWVDEAGAECEYLINRIQNSNRRMDIFIAMPKLTPEMEIVIENKPWAGDQHQQLDDYGKHLERSGLKKWCLIYLDRIGEAPS